MNQKLKFLMVLILVSLLLGCENDNFNKNTPEQQTERLNIKLTTWEEFESHHKNIVSKVDEFRNSKTNKNINESNKYGFYINDSRVQIIENENFTTYTFFVYRNNPDPNILENYTYKEYEDGSYEQFLIKYHYTIDDNGSMIFDTNTLDVEIIDDTDLVLSKNSCTPEFTQVIDDIVCTSNTNCTGAGNHEPGDDQCTCDSSPTTCDPAGSMSCEIQYVWVYQSCGGEGDPFPSGTNEPATNTGGGGTSNNNNNNTNNNTQSVPVEDPTPIYQPIEDCINGQLSLGGSDSTTIDPALLEQIELSKPEWYQINTYLQDNNCSEQAQQEVIDDLLEEFDEQIFIDEDFKNIPCLKSVYDDMGKASTFNNYLQNFDADMSVADLRFSTDDNFSSNYETKYHNAMAITNPPLSSNEILIEFNTDPSTNGNILDKPNVFRAVAMIHEIIHAEMYRKMLDAMIEAEGQGTTLDWTEMNRFEFDQYLETLQNKYFGIWEYYVRYNDNDDTPDNGQHQQMAQHYRDIIKDALTDYDPTLSENQKNALSWIGLNEANVVAWQNIDEDLNLNTEDEQNAINFMINQIQNTFPNDCP